MGKLMHHTQIHHSTHPHLLQLSSSLHLQNPTNCAVCNLHIAPSDHHIYTCTPCNFFLHPSCSKFPDLFTHPSHPHHTLSLLPSPHGLFRCVACTQQGNNRFSYHCQVCDFNLHVLCASKPLSVTHPTHPHPLLLTFSSPYDENMGFSCDLCRGVGSSDQWLYRCVSCQFDVHLHCASVKMPHPPPPPPLQHHHSFPNQFVAPPLAAQPLTRSMSVGHVQRYTQPLQTPAPVGVHSYRQAPHPPAPVGVQSYRLPQQPPAPVVGVQSYQLPQQPPAPVGVQSYPLPQQPPAPVGVQSYRLPQQPPAPVGVQSYQLPPQPPAPVGVQSYRLPPQPALPTLNIGLASGLGTAMVTRFVEGTMQQLGQNFIQDLTGGGGGSGGDICGDGGDMLLEIIQQVAEPLLDLS